MDETGPTPVREKPPEPPLTTLEAVLIFGLIAIALGSCSMLYGPLLKKIYEMMTGGL